MFFRMIQGNPEEQAKKQSTNKEMGCLETARYLGCRGGQRQTQSSKQGPDRKARQREGDYDDGAQRQRTQTDYNEHVKAFTKGGSFNRSNYQ